MIELFINLTKYFKKENMTMSKKYTGPNTVKAIMSLFNGLLNSKQDLLDEINAEETQAMWDALGNNEPGVIITPRSIVVQVVLENNVIATTGTISLSSTRDGVNRQEVTLNGFNKSSIDLSDDLATDIQNGLNVTIQAITDGYTSNVASINKSTFDSLSVDGKLYIQFRSDTQDPIIGNSF